MSLPRKPAHAAPPHNADADAARDPNAITVDQALRQGTAFLRERGFESPRLEMELMMADAMGMDRLKLYLNLQTTLEPKAREKSRESLRRRVKREPLAYILGRKEFYGLPFEVTRDTLIPRPETELVVDRALRFLRARAAAAAAADVDQVDQVDGVDGVDAGSGEETAEPRKPEATAATSAPISAEATAEPGPDAAETDEPGPDAADVNELSFADIGTGSGAIAVAIAATWRRRPVSEEAAPALPALAGSAIDLSPGALEVARRNAERHAVADALEFITGDLLAPLAGPVDLIVSNPPYIPESDRASLPPDVAEWEPELALFSGADGMTAISRLVAEAADRLKPGGALIFEIGFGQANAVRAALEATGRFDEIVIHPDLAGIPRVAEARLGL